jgi:hypothetical protein
MTLNNPNPVTTEPVASKDFPHLWLYNIRVHAPSVTTGSITIETLPYNSETQEIGSGSNMVAIQTDDLWNAVNEVPEAAQAMGAIFMAIEPLRAWIEEQKQKEINNQEEP